MPQLEGPATRIYNYVPGGFGEKKKKKKDWQWILAQVPVLKKQNKIKYKLNMEYSLKVCLHQETNNQGLNLEGLYKKIRLNLYIFHGSFLKMKP